MRNKTYNITIGPDNDIRINRNYGLTMMANFELKELIECADAIKSAVQNQIDQIQNPLAPKLSKPTANFSAPTQSISPK
jgi:hypothetical protein